MNIYYVVWAEIPSRAAHSLHFMKQCQALAANANNVSLVLPSSSANDQFTDQEIFDYYGVADNFKLIRITTPRLPGKKMLYGIQAALSADKADILYTRDIDIASISTLKGIKTILELHVPLDSSLTRKKHFWAFLRKKLFTSKNLLRLVVISKALKKNIVESGVNERLVTVAHDGSDLPMTKVEVNYPDRKNYAAEIGYVGHLYEGKGMEIISEVAQLVKEARFHVVGGLEKDIDRWKQKTAELGIMNIVFHGFMQQGEISKYLNSFDICLLPNQRTIRVYGNSGANISDFTSPLKMFDYMAHGKAIVSSDLPVLREVLNEHNSVLCDPDNTEIWAEEIRKLIKDESGRKKLGEQAFIDFKNNYTWRKRAELLINGL